MRPPRSTTFFVRLSLFVLFFQCPSCKWVFNKIERFKNRTFEYFLRSQNFLSIQNKTKSSVFGSARWWQDQEDNEKFWSLHCFELYIDFGMINSKEIYVYPAERCHTFTKANLQTVFKTASLFFECFLSFLNSVVRNIFDYLSLDLFLQIHIIFDPCTLGDFDWEMWFTPPKPKVRSFDWSFFCFLLSFVLYPVMKFLCQCLK